MKSRPRLWVIIEMLTIMSGMFGVFLRLEFRAGYMRAWLAAPDEAARAAVQEYTRNDLVI